MKMKVAAAARVTGVPARTIHRWVDDGDILAWDDSDGLTLVDDDEVVRVRREKTATRLRNLRGNGLVER